MMFEFFILQKPSPSHWKMTIVKLDFLMKLKGKPSLISKDKKIITEYFNQ